ncbi:hypothetical protein I6F35_00280 [Bradyrhizobium sp. BRP22]|nr:hypothetical protein [Bradyrhizobium sp. BRP22]
MLFFLVEGIAALIIGFAALFVNFAPVWSAAIKPPAAFIKPGDARSGSRQLRNALRCFRHRSAVEWIRAGALDLLAVRRADIGTGTLSSARHDDRIRLLKRGSRKNYPHGGISQQRVAACSQCKLPRCTSLNRNSKKHGAQRSLQRRRKRQGEVHGSTVQPRVRCTREMVAVA